MTDEIRYPLRVNGATIEDSNGRFIAEARDDATALKIANVWNDKQRNKKIWERVNEEFNDWWEKNPA